MELGGTDLKKHSINQDKMDNGVLLKKEFSTLKVYALDYLREFVQHRLDSHFKSHTITLAPEIPAPENWTFHVPKNLLSAGLGKEELTLLLLALSPHVDGTLLDEIIQSTIESAGDFPQLGGVRGKNFRGFLPTGETALFLLAGRDTNKRNQVRQFFKPEHFFAKHGILWLEDPPEGEPAMSGRIIFSHDFAEMLIHGKVSRPRFSMKFPAEVIETSMEWEDLVLNSETELQIRELFSWIKYGSFLMQDWGMKRKLKPGYRVLFHGPPGTGKTLTATLLGKYTGKEVFKIDLSMVVSKFIGETEKNLARLLANAEKTENILFFDEADALFGKRTSVKDAHDKYANQEVSYLLQRIENYKGLVILASNFKSNIDDAFVRRFQSIVHFPLPNATERLLLWKKAFPGRVRLHADLSLQQLAEKYDLSGAEIMNIVQFACLRALEDGKVTINKNYVLNGIKREYQKGGRVMR